MRPCGGVKNVNHKYYTNMQFILLKLSGVVDVKPTKETYCPRWGLRSLCPLRVVDIQTIDIFIRGCYL